MSNSINHQAVEAACAVLSQAAAGAGAKVDVVANPALTGYRQLSADEVELVEEVKKFGIGLGDMIAELMTNAATDKRWVSIAATHFQQGLMAATRAVAKPTTF